jgi:hypothetical protein
VRQKLTSELFALSFLCLDGLLCASVIASGLACCTTCVPTCAQRELRNSLARDLRALGFEQSIQQNMVTNANSYRPHAGHIPVP